MKLNFKILLIIAFALLFACGKKPIATEEKQKDTFYFQEQKFDNVLKVNKSEEINDYFKLAVPYFITGSSDKNCDSLCNLQKERWLKDMATAKKSGNNEYSFAYNELTKQLELNVRIGATVDSLKKELSSKNALLIQAESSKKTILVRYVPKWIKILAIIGGIAIIYHIFKILKHFKII